MEYLFLEFKKTKSYPPFLTTNLVLILGTSIFYTFTANKGFEQGSDPFRIYFRVYFMFYHITNLLVSYCTISYIRLDLDKCLTKDISWPINYRKLLFSKILFYVFVQSFTLYLALTLYTLFSSVTLPEFFQSFSYYFPLMFQLSGKLLLLSIPYWLLMFYLAKYVHNKFIIYALPPLFMVLSVFTIFQFLPFGIFSQEVLRLISNNLSEVLLSKDSLLLSLISTLTIIIVEQIWYQFETRTTS